MIVNKYTAPLNSKIGELNKEIETLKSAEKPAGATDQSDIHNHAADLAIAKAEHEANLKAALDQKENIMNRQSDLKVKLTKGQLSALKVKWAVFEKAAKETPTEEVAKVYEVAKNAKDTTAAQTGTPVKPQVPMPAHQAIQTQQGSIPRPASALGQQVSAHIQTNGAPVQQPSPFQQGAQNAGSNAAPNPFSQAARGIATPGFTTQTQTAPVQQTQPQQAGRGHGTGPAALKSILGAGQTGIPRGGSGIPQPGSGIPQPGGRGAGRGQQPNPAQNQSGIARGGAVRGGRGGGRGQGQSQNNSPRTSLNPGASQFQPGQGAGRGQKRNADGEVDGSGARGSKRPRGGRGGQGGGEGASGAPAAAE